MICDRYGLPLTTTSDRAAAYYVDGVDRMLAALHGADAAFEAAIAEDPDFALAHLGRARVHQLNMEGAGPAPRLPTPGSSWRLPPHASANTSRSSHP